MKKPGFFFLVAIGLLSLIFIVSSSWAQSGRRLHYSMLFNPGTVGTISGEVVRVEHTSAGKRPIMRPCPAEDPARAGDRDPGAQGLHGKPGVAILPKDRVTVTGSLISVLESPSSWPWR